MIYRIEFISCEGNPRHTTIAVPDEWSEDDIRHQLLVINGGSCGDDLSEIISIESDPYGDDSDANESYV